MLAVKKQPLLYNEYTLYILTSFGFGLFVTVLALWSSPNGWNDFFNSKPVRGDMGFGQFLIRGSRYIDGIKQKKKKIAYSSVLIA